MMFRYFKLALMLLLAADISYAAKHDLIVPLLVDVSLMTLIDQVSIAFRLAKEFIKRTTGSA